MDAPALIKAFVVSCVLPPGGFVLLALFGLTAMLRWFKFGRACTWIGVTGLVIASLPITAATLTQPLDDGRRFDAAQAQGIGAIVIPGGGTRLDADDRETVGRLTLERVREGARIARMTRLPILVTGGPTNDDGTTTEAGLMRDALEREFHQPVRWSESRARNTRENALNSARLLRSAGVQRVVLVLHPFDVRRARREFEAAGLDVVVATVFTSELGNLTFSDWLPDVHAIEQVHYAAYEWLGLLVRRS